MKLKNIIGMGYGVLKGKVSRRKIPLNVMYSVTDRCPSRCGYCNIPAREKKELTTAQAFSLIDQISDLGCQRLGLWGGEPLVRDDIGEIIDHAKKRGLFVTLDSNGYLIPEKIKALKRLDHLVLAFDGSEAGHDSNRESGSFQKAMAAIETLSGRMPFWTITVLTKYNLNDIDFILDKAREYGFLATFQLPHHNNKLAPDNSAFLAEDPDYRRAVKKLIDEKKKGAPIASGFKYLYHVLRWKDYGKPVSPENVNGLQCHAGRFYCNVDTDGSLSPCSLLVDKTGSLNFLEAGFGKAFENLNRGACEGCAASCFTEYNYLYSLDVLTAFEWMRAMRRGNR